MFWHFINEHIADNPDKLRLKYAGSDFDFDVAFAITQIDCRQRTTRKLTSFVGENSKFIFPSTLSAEQCTSEAVARFHASLIPERCNILDMTCGLGIDAMTMAAKASSVTAIERNSETVNALKHNIQCLGIDNLKIIEADSSVWIENCDKKFDVIFIDPARRSQNNRRLFSLADCSPDAQALMPRMLKVAERVIVKCSPMLDISHLLKTLRGINRVSVLCLNGECKEVVLEISQFKSEPLIEVVETSLPENERLQLSYNLYENSADDIRYLTSELFPGMWLYEPDAGVMKTGAWGVLCRKFSGLEKLHPNTQLFVSLNKVQNFPGRCLKIEEIISGKDAKKKLKSCKLNVVSRNYPLSPELLRKKYGIQDGGKSFLYAVTANSSPLLLMCSLMQKEI